MEYDAPETDIFGRRKENFPIRQYREETALRDLSQRSY